MRTFTTLALLMSTAASCATDSDIWTPPTSSGKADGIQILDGHDIPSQYVDASKHYLVSRRIDSLEHVHALEGALDSLAQRVDGILPGTHGNGRLEVAELVRMENPQVFAALYPAEKAALPMLWPLLLAPDGPAVKVATPDVDVATHEQRTEPSALTEPSSISISSLPSSLQSVAGRVELLFDADNNSATIQVADVDKALANPQGFTSTEVTQLQKLKAVFHARATSNARSTWIVPSPGKTSKTTQVGDMTVELTTDVVIFEHRTMREGPYCACDFLEWDGYVEVDHTNDVRLDVGGGDGVVLLALDTRTEAVFDTAEVHPDKLSAGLYIVERYSHGARQATQLVAFPAFDLGEDGLIEDMLDYQLVAGGTPLVKFPVEVSGTGDLALNYHWEMTAHPNPTISASAVQTLATPRTSLPAGRYEVSFPTGVIALDIYPEGAVFARIGSATSRLHYGAAMNKKALVGDKDTYGQPRLLFWPSENQLQWKGYTVTVDASQRTM